MTSDSTHVMCLHGTVKCFRLSHLKITSLICQHRVSKRHHYCGEKRNAGKDGKMHVYCFIPSSIDALTWTRVPVALFHCGCDLWPCLFGANACCLRALITMLGLSVPSLNVGSWRQRWLNWQWDRVTGLAFCKVIQESGDYLGHAD